MAKGMMDKGKAHSAAGHAGMMHEMHMGMEMDMEMEMKSSMDDISQEHDCCNDLETFLKTGQMCKTSQTCSASGAGLLTAALSVSVVPSTTDFLPDIPPSLRSAHPIGVWRPPTIS